MLDLLSRAGTEMLKALTNARSLIWQEGRIVGRFVVNAMVSLH